MWKELASCGVMITIIALIFGYLMNRMGKVEAMLEHKVDESMCEQKYGEMGKALTRGENTFDKIQEQLQQQGKLLIQIDTTVKMILERGREG